MTSSNDDGGSSIRPNVVLMVGDNVGWGDIGCYGGESTSGPIVKPQWPLIFDLIDDPAEEWDMVEQRLEGAWAIAPVARRLGALQQSMTQCPNIKPGEDFTGYP